MKLTKILALQCLIVLICAVYLVNADDAASSTSSSSSSSSSSTEDSSLASDASYFISSMISSSSAESSLASSTSSSSCESSSSSSSEASSTSSTLAANTMPTTQIDIIWMVFLAMCLCMFIGFYIQPEGGMMFRTIGCMLLIILGVEMFMNILYLGWGDYNILQYKISPGMYNGAGHMLAGLLFIIAGVRFYLLSRKFNYNIEGGLAA